MLERGEVHSNLMRAPGVELDFHESSVVNPRKRLPVRPRGAWIGNSFAMPGFVLRGHSCAMNRVAPTGQLDAPGHFPENALHQSEIRFLDGALSKRFAQFRVCRVVFRHDDYAGSFL